MTFILTLINRKSSLSYVEATTALVNLDLRRKEKEFFNGTSVEVSSEEEVQTKEKEIMVDQN